MIGAASTGHRGAFRAGGHEAAKDPHGARCAARTKPTPARSGGVPDRPETGQGSEIAIPLNPACLLEAALRKPE
jgi:hypothetical protein